MSVTETTSTGFFQQIFDSVIGMLIGIVLIPASFLPIIYGEFIMTNFGAVVDASSVLNAASPEAALNGKNVTVTGNATVVEPAVDPEYLKGGNWVKLERSPEMYAWVENVKSETKKKGTKKETTKTYTYEMKWVSSVPDSSKFKNPKGHSNPSMTLESANFKAKGVKVGSVAVNLDKATIKDGGQITPEASMITKPNMTLSGSYLYSRAGAESEPWVGDTRISFYGVEYPKEGAQATAYGKFTGSEISYDNENGGQFLMLGTREALSAQLHAEFVTMQWIMRILMFIMLAAGMIMVAGPITNLLDFIPFIGELGSGLIKFVLAAIAFVITVITSLLAHYFWIVLIVLIGVGIWAKFIRKPKESAPAAPAETPAE